MEEAESKGSLDQDRKRRSSYSGQPIFVFLCDRDVLREKQSRQEAGRKMVTMAPMATEGGKPARTYRRKAVNI